MAIVILGGLLSATALNMIVLPALCWILGPQVIGASDERESLEADATAQGYPTLTPRTT